MPALPLQPLPGLPATCTCLACLVHALPCQLPAHFPAAGRPLPALPSTAARRHYPLLATACTCLQPLPSPASQHSPTSLLAAACPAAWPCLPYWPLPCLTATACPACLPACLSALARLPAAAWHCLPRPACLLHCPALSAAPVPAYPASLDNTACHALQRCLPCSLVAACPALATALPCPWPLACPAPAPACLLPAQPLPALPYSTCTLPSQQHCLPPLLPPSPLNAALRLSLPALPLACLPAWRSPALPSPQPAACPACRACTACPAWPPLSCHLPCSTSGTALALLHCLPRTLPALPALLADTACRTALPAPAGLLHCPAACLSAAPPATACTAAALHSLTLPCLPWHCLPFCSAYTLLPALQPGTPAPTATALPAPCPGTACVLAPLPAHSCPALLPCPPARLHTCSLELYLPLALALPATAFLAPACLTQHCPASARLPRPAPGPACAALHPPASWHCLPVFTCQHFTCYLPALPALPACTACPALQHLPALPDPAPAAYVPCLRLTACPLMPPALPATPTPSPASGQHLPALPLCPALLPNTAACSLLLPALPHSTATPPLTAPACPAA
ncbi:proline-rich protein 36-like [Coregonus clupeaformis]|uniref:proline-rich protein 36-like n=1 Tax=Coregonus clupeaformis TaxID=59861 RepID=UPI001E1C3D6E|nr:proline-rich protein 36-like [Coregonus clupeaformis]